MDQRAEVIQALGDWIVYVTKSKSATTAEIEALPKVAEVYFKNYSRGLLKLDTQDKILIDGKSVIENIKLAENK